MGSFSNNLSEESIMRGSPINLEVQATTWDGTINNDDGILPITIGPVKPNYSNPAEVPWFLLVLASQDALQV